MKLESTKTFYLSNERRQTEINRIIKVEKCQKEEVIAFESQIQKQVVCFSVTHRTGLPIFSFLPQRPRRLS